MVLLGRFEKDFILSKRGEVELSPPIDYSQVQERGAQETKRGSHNVNKQNTDNIYVDSTRAVQCRRVHNNKCT